MGHKEWAEFQQTEEEIRVEGKAPWKRERVSKSADAVVGAALIGIGAHFGGRRGQGQLQGDSK